MANLCNIDGVTTAEADARIPVLDRGFLFGDSIYEVVRTHGPVPLAWREHWARLEASAAALGMQLDLTEATVAGRVAETVAASGIGDCYVRLVVTRGAGSAPNIDLAYAPEHPCWVIMVRPRPEIRGQPAKVWLVDRLRNDRRALDPATKSGNYLNNVLGLAEAKANGATDCVMLNAQGHVTEASTSNLFVRSGGVWVTPTLQSGILAGITRSLLIDFLQRQGEAVAERDLTGDELLAADELFLSSTLKDVSPVTHLNGRALHGGEAGPATQRLMPAFAAHLEQRLTEVDGPYWQRLLGR
ncbi:MAG: aminotransferase class IV [Planctomycetota bacterium]